MHVFDLFDNKKYISGWINKLKKKNNKKLETIGTLKIITKQKQKLLVSVPSKYHHFRFAKSIYTYNCIFCSPKFNWT